MNRKKLNINFGIFLFHTYVSSRIRFWELVKNNGFKFYATGFWLTKQGNTLVCSLHTSCGWTRNSTDLKFNTLIILDFNYILPIFCWNKLAISVSKEGKETACHTRFLLYEVKIIRKAFLLDFFRLIFTTQALNWRKGC